MAWRECLAHDTAVVYIYGFICHRCQSFITFIEYRDCKVVTQFCTFFSICVYLNLTFINYCSKFILNLCVKNFTDMFCSEACIESIFADTDTDHITLSCMHKTFYTVQIRVEFTFEYRFEVCLHALSCYFYYITDRVLASYFKCIDIRSDDFDLMVFDLRCFFGLNKFETVNTGTIEFNLHITTTDDFTFKCRCECYRNVDVCNLDLDISCFQRSCIEFADIFLNDQALWYTAVYSIYCRLVVCDYRETKSDCACTTSYDYFIQWSECIYECRYTFHCVLHQSCSISWLNVTEDQSCSDSYRYNMDNRCNIFSKRDYTNVSACLISEFFTLINDSTNQSYQNTLCLIRFYKVNTFLSSWSCTKNNCNTWDISGYKWYTKFTDYSITKMSVARSFVWCCSIHIFQCFNKFCTKSSSYTRHEYIIQSFFSCH